MPGKLNIAFLWHMHQPYYRDPKTGEYLLPWVRLHGLKGYTDMLEAVRRFGGVRVTFNFVPCLIRQLSDLASGRNSDLYYDLSLKPAEDLDPPEKKIILRHFFSANQGTMILPYPRYRELFHRRGKRVSDKALDSLSGAFSSQDFLDLQVWFNLTWFGWAAEERHPLIAEFKRKDRNFSEDEKIQLLRLQLDVLKDIIPAYKSAWEENLIEISTTPYYHPILPLIVDLQAARISQPKDPMPERELQRPSDAREQLQSGRDYIGEQFGRRPVGLWPSEGSVSPAVCELADQAGFEWLATDEDVLLATLKGKKRNVVLYQSYRTYEGGPTIVFRDRFLSDAIGFRYARNTPKRSVEDFIGHLGTIAASRSHPEESIVAVIMDGENAWEYFPDGGRGFFEELYSHLTDHPKLETITVSEYIRRNPAKSVLPPIFPASWIGGSFRIWIGDPVKNQAWDRMAEAAAVLDERAENGYDQQAIEKARQWLFAAEGSDWFWWYGEPNHSDFEPDFDYLFRSNLMQVYKELDWDVPELLSRPITETVSSEEEISLFPMNPTVDGRETNFYEWAGARVIHTGDFSGSMKFTSSLLVKLYYGISETHFFLRLDPTDRFRDAENLEVIIRFNSEKAPVLAIKNLSRGRELEINWQGERTPGHQPEAVFDRILELKIPFACLQNERSEVLFTITIKQDNLEAERWPREGSYACPWPTPEYLTANWVI